jgi:hypothetical protein
MRDLRAPSRLQGRYPVMPGDWRDLYGVHSGRERLPLQVLDTTDVYRESRDPLAFKELNGIEPGDFLRVVIMKPKRLTDGLCATALSVSIPSSPSITGKVERVSTRTEGRLQIMVVGGLFRGKYDRARVGISEDTFIYVEVGGKREVATMDEVLEGQTIEAFSSSVVQLLEPVRFLPVQIVILDE